MNIHLVRNSLNANFSKSQKSHYARTRCTVKVRSRKFPVFLSPKLIFREIAEVKKNLKRVLYIITSLNGDAVIGKFYQGQLTKVLDQDEYLIEDILEENETHYLIKFLDYAEPEWVPKENVSNTIKDML